MALLVWSDASGAHELDLGQTRSIGRSDGCDIRLHDQMVSSVHARVFNEDGHWVMEDLDSMNGSFVNGRRQIRSVLQDGDLVRVGVVELTFHLAAPLPGETPPLPTDRQGPATPASGRETDIEGICRNDRQITPMNTIDVSSVSATPGADELDDPTALARRLKASYEISSATAATLDLSEVLNRVLTALFEIFESSERAFIMLIDAETQETSNAAVKCRTDHNEAINISRTVLKQVLEKKEALLCEDTTLDDRFAEVQSIADFGIRSMMTAPLLFKDQLYGVIHIDTLSRTAPFTQSDLELLSFAAMEVAGSVADAELHRKVVDAERLAAVGQTVAGLSHCIKNILQALKGGAYILERGISNKNFDHVISGWDVVKGKNLFLEELVWDLLNFSKPRVPEYESTDLNALCAEICEMGSESVADNQATTVTFTPDPKLEPAEIDKKGVRRSILNLVTNAVDACAENEEGGAVAVETRAPGDDGMAVVVVADNGCGMSDETQAKLFSVFFSTKGSRGTGLGLPITKKLVEEHGGHVLVESRESEGTTFTMSLPAKRNSDTQKG